MSLGSSLGQKSTKVILSIYFSPHISQAVRDNSARCTVYEVQKEQYMKKRNNAPNSKNKRGAELNCSGQ